MGKFLQCPLVDAVLLPSATTRLLKKTMERLQGRVAKQKKQFAVGKKKNKMLNDKSVHVPIKPGAVVTFSLSF